MNSPTPTPMRHSTANVSAVSQPQDHAHISPHTHSVHSANNKASSRHVMLISGSAELSEAIQADLFSEGYRVSVFHDGLRGLLAAKRYEPDLLLVDWAPPRITGLELCTRLRATDPKKPIVLLTQNNDSKERVLGLRSGVDDCISPPFETEEFVSRINVRLARLHLESEPTETLRCADLILNRRTRDVYVDGEAIRLTAKEFDLLEYLMLNYYRVVSRSQIIESVWGYHYSGSSNIVEVYVRYLRNKLGNKAARFIRTVRGVGYILRDD